MGKRVSTRGSADRPLRPAAGSQFQQRLGRLGRKTPKARQENGVWKFL